MNAEEFHSSPFPIERWLKLAEQKLKQDYTLIADMERRSARFFKRGVGYEPCPFQVAQVLIGGDFVSAIGDHDLGTMYRLQSEVRHLALARDDEEADEIEEEETFDDEESEFEEDEDEEVSDVAEEAGEGFDPEDIDD